MGRVKKINQDWYRLVFFIKVHFSTDSLLAQACLSYEQQLDPSYHPRLAVVIKDPLESHRERVDRF
jgi:hypothetical protein